MAWEHLLCKWDEYDVNDVYDAHDMLISQAFKEPDPSSKDGNLQQQENNRYKENENNREILTTLSIHKGKKVNTTESTENSHKQSTKKWIPSNKPGGDSQQWRSKDGVQTNESHPTSLEVILNKTQTKIQTKTDGLLEWGSSGNGTGLSTVSILSILVEG